MVPIVFQELTFFHVFKCSKQDCQWHKSLRSGSIEVFGEPIANLDENNMFKKI